jgi:hypothetical protein
MARGDFGKAFGIYKKSGGTMNRNEFAQQYKKEKKEKSE